MTERTVMFLVHLSHQWAPIVLPLPILFGITTYGAGALNVRARARGNALGQRVSAIARTGSRILLAVSIVVFVVSIGHFGCAALKARSVQCLSNVKQLSLGVLMYAQDYDERFPASARWAEVIDSRVREAVVFGTEERGDPFRCPSAESPASYGMNAALGGFSINDIDAPADTVMLFDADALTRSFAGGSGDIAQSRHEGMPNVAFVDGHAKNVNAYFLQNLQNLNWAPKEPAGHRQSWP